MSRKPGIARQYYDDHPELYQYEFINLPTDVGGLKFRPLAILISFLRYRSSRRIGTG